MSEDDFFDFEAKEVPARSPHLVPWIVTGLVSIAALLISVVALNVSRGAENDAKDPDPPVVQEDTEQEESEQKPEAEKPKPEPEQPKPSDPTRPDEDIDTSKNDVGSVYNLEVPWEGWGIKTEVSNKLGDWTYELVDGNQKLQLEASLISSLPKSCEHMKTKWGLEKKANKFVSMSPQELCAENESLYVELLAIVRHMEKTVKPLNG